MRAGATKVSSIALACVLVTVGLASLWAVLSIRSTVAEMADATGRLGAYARLQRAVAEEAFAEAGYRRAPTPEARARVEQSITATNQAVAEARLIAADTDQTVLTAVTASNDRYAAEVRTSLDTPVTAGTGDRVAGPALDSIQSVLDGAVEGHRKEVRAATQRQLDLIRTLGIVVPLVMGAAFLALALSRHLLLREHARLTARSADSEYRALHDPLTGLANRRLFSSALAHLLGAKDPSAAVLFVDLDDFKTINDTLGHDAGDQVLTAIAERLSMTTRGDLAARLGGDEFAILLQPATEPDIVAQRILTAIALPVTIRGLPITISASIGIAEAPTDGQSPHELLQAADDALYIAKAAGKGQAARPTTPAGPDTTAAQPRSTSGTLDPQP